MADDGKTFDFVDVNPGMSGMAFAAEAEGGVCVGVARIRPSQVSAYEDFFGRGSSAAPVTGCEVVLADLPFSMFVRAHKGDPAVTELVVEAARLARTASAAVFRVSWSAAGRMGVETDEYRSAVEHVFEGSKWEVRTAVSADRNDMFVFALSRVRWNGREPLPTASASAVSHLKRSNPQEILLSLGYPENFALRNAGSDSKLLEGIVDVGNARAAIVGALGSVR